MSSQLTLLNWNIERRSPDSWQAGSITQEISGYAPDIVCLTEAHERSTGPLTGHAIDVRGQNWSPTAASERKVVLWSRNPWHRVETPDKLNQIGAAVIGTTSTPVGDLRVMGICIPYHRASPYGSDMPAKMWEQHGLFIDGLNSFLKSGAAVKPDIIVGDFNRKLPSTWGPTALVQGLEEALAGYDIVTRGSLPPADARTVDHVALGAGLKCFSSQLLSAVDGDGRARSDHDGVLVKLAGRKHPPLHSR
jgi:endonuclease/exonuclease/phosphatase family metal-dependent hydrolase